MTSVTVSIHAYKKDNIEVRFVPSDGTVCSTDHFTVSMGQDATLFLSPDMMEELSKKLVGAIAGVRKGKQK
jgi:hypothetical protein